MERSAACEAPGCYDQSQVALGHLLDQHERHEQAVGLQRNLGSGCTVREEHERAQRDHSRCSSGAMHRST